MLNDLKNNPGVRIIAIGALANIVLAALKIAGGISQAGPITRMPIPMSKPVRFRTATPYVIEGSKRRS